jgi:hypothetical protein
MRVLPERYSTLMTPSVSINAGRISTTSVRAAKALNSRTASVSSELRLSLENQ